MGNLKLVHQIAPWLGRRGAAIELRDGATPIGDFPTYVYAGAVGDRQFVCVQTGGKWGYDSDFHDWLQTNAPHLHDCVFLINDENRTYCERFEIAGGVLHTEHVGGAGSVAALWLIGAAREYRAQAIELLANELDGVTFYLGEEDGEHAHLVAALVEHAPERWETWFHHGARLHERSNAGELDYDVDPPRPFPVDPAAVEALEKARALAPDAKRCLVEAKLAEAYTAIDPVLALAFGKRCFEGWVIAARAEHGMFDPPVRKAVARVVEQELEHGDPDVAQDLWLSSLHPEERDTALRYCETAAAAHAGAGDDHEARRWRRAVTVLRA